MRITPNLETYASWNLEECFAAVEIVSIRLHEVLPRVPDNVVFGVGEGTYEAWTQHLNKPNIHSRRAMVTMIRVLDNLKGVMSNEEIGRWLSEREGNWEHRFNALSYAGTEAQDELLALTVQQKQTSRCSLQEVRRARIDHESVDALAKKMAEVVTRHVTKPSPHNEL